MIDKIEKLKKLEKLEKLEKGNSIIREKTISLDNEDYTS